MTTIYLIPSPLDEDAVESIPQYVLQALEQCQVIFAENERTSRRFLKKVNKDIVIDRFEWHTIEKNGDKHLGIFRNKIKEEKNIAIISEAGCPGIADPGQALVAIAHAMKCRIKPLSGPISPMLALMASGMNGQRFEFMGYLPIDNGERIKALKELESTSRKNNSTQLFIETPYRNKQLLECILQTCAPDTLLCIAANLTGSGEYIKTMTVMEWKKQIPDLHKKPALFLIYAGKPVAG